MKSILLFILFVLMVNVSNGQIKYGIKAGLNLAAIENEEPDNSMARAGLHAGALLQIRLSGKYSLQPEVLYSMKGYRFPATDNGQKGRVSLTYINLPLLLRYSATKNLALLIGPEFGYMLSAKSKFDDRTYDLPWFEREFDIGAALGLSHGVTNRFGMDLRYIHGFGKLLKTTITDPSGNTIGTKLMMSNRVAQLGVYYLISE